MKAKALATLTILLTSISYAEEYSALKESREYVNCLNESLLAAPKCAKAERLNKESEITTEINAIIYTHQSSIPDIREQIENAQARWAHYAHKKCVSNDVRLSDLCIAKLSDYRATYFSAFNQFNGNIQTLLKDISNHEANDTLAAALINSFLPQVELDQIKQDSELFSNNKILNPTTSQELLYNAQQITDHGNVERESLIKKSAEKRNLYSSILLFQDYVYSGNIAKIKFSEEIITEIERNIDIGFLSETLRAEIQPNLKAAARAQGATAYRSFMRESMLNGSEVQMYAAFIEESMLNGPTCEKLALLIYDYADSNAADNVKKLMIDNLASGAINAGCLIP
ncbi:hypothetical protein [Aquipseudomonas alcaligenes]|uniref:Lysozyme inhibitor LprI N-terminal domain-containing protein n=1 Tax=Aquipseudomonas alcaligenes TaxID=43263 RepID=A0AA37FNB5_AQUAC|nr:hypothetical protein [Pseudomonas alcaligenes]BCR23993.1 hypothetical protein KAM426_15200 [Pseudomonas alcaligenes]GIZ69199.1 hypothetical protein KAM428_42840 [Pseudomonas alcaligenes]GIZ73378.1 hypothetical protein KAM429_41390 [Pseudomonas alcaligenes]GIZ82071.1 hypothetical protein KAM432_41190 [Pseudomonas alcaligenes]GIZ86452.1 hypothetical protein KAM434_41470 [Pseudomonas alcaligenes]